MNITWLFLLVTCSLKLSSSVPIRFNGLDLAGSEHYGGDHLGSAGNEHHGLGILKPPSRKRRGGLTLNYKARDIKEYGATYKWTNKPRCSRPSRPKDTGFSILDFDDFGNTGAAHHGMSSSMYPGFGDWDYAGSEHHGFDDSGLAGSNHR
ncbi:hypothetical protein CLF_105887, partial [Clonorchis sinensis]